MQRPGGQRQLLTQGPAQAAPGAERAGVHPFTPLRDPESSPPESRTEAGMALRGPPSSPQFWKRGLEIGARDSGRGVSSRGFVNSAICMARPGADGRVPEGAAPALTHVYQHVDTHGVCGTCYTSSPAPGEPDRATLGLGLLASGREGPDRPWLLSGTEFQPGEPVWLLRGSLAREQMGVPMAILMADPSPACPSKEAQAAIVLGET